MIGIKTLVFTSLYTLAAVAGWGAYNAITKQDTSLDSMSNLARQTNQKIMKSFEKDNKQLYRYKNEDNQWVYSNKPLETDTAVIDKYQKEVKFLQKLSPESMPTKDFITKPQQQIILKQIATKKDVPKNKILEEARNVAKMMNDHTKMLNDIAFGKKDEE